MNIMNQVILKAILNYFKLLSLTFMNDPLTSSAKINLKDWLKYLIEKR
jgi:hypothetical protein